MVVSVMRGFNSFFFFFNDTATTEIYTLSLHDALPIFPVAFACAALVVDRRRAVRRYWPVDDERSEEHTSELQSQSNLVCRLLLEKKKRPNTTLSNPDCYRMVHMTINYLLSLFDESLLL